MSGSGELITKLLVVSLGMLALRQQTSEQRRGAASNVVSLPRVGGLDHRYAWRQAA